MGVLITRRATPGRTLGVVTRGLANIPTAALLHRWSPAVGVTAGAQARVSEWRDLVGTAHFTQATDANRPTLVPHVPGLNGRPAIRLAYSGDARQCIMATAAVAGHAQPFTLFCVTYDITNVLGASFGTVFDGASGSARNYLGYTFASGDVTMYAGSAISQTATLASAQVVVAHFNTTSSKLRTGASAYTATATAGTQNAASFRLGYDGDGLNYGTGYIGEIVMYSGNLSDADADTVRAALARHYGVAL